ncbi:MAG: aminotransferase class V-fold PLP-dependent enzyme [Verrucomicrobiales bacterium]|nr:aminotransferase class V-fold PLP-dependent enzyme [Verrucomicrobiales bacterium]
MIYLDNNATTQVAPEVREAILPWLGENYGNPSGGYRFGKAAKKAINLAREQVADLIGAHPEEIVFTSGGTESSHTALRSAMALRPERKTILTSTVEHSAVYELAKFHGQTGYDVRLNPVDSQGRLDLGQWQQNLANDTVAVVSLIWANNETGVISPIAEAAALAAEKDVYFHTDAVQAVGKIPVKVSEMPLHALSISAHKFHGPKGVGALYLNRHARFQPEILGGGQENERRSGTENVPGIVGMGVAAGLAKQFLEETAALARLRDEFEKQVMAAIPGVEVHGGESPRLPNTGNLYFPGVDGEGLLILLDEAGICCSPGSACSTGAVQPSRIIKVMGFSSSRARSSVRFSLSRLNSEDEISAAVDAIQNAVAKLQVVMPSGGGRVISSSRKA